MLFESVQWHIRSRPNEIAVIANGRSRSWADVGAAVDGVSAGLLKEGLSPGDTVGLTINDEYEHFIVALALIRLGCVHIILPSHEPQFYREALAARVKVAVVVTSGSEWAVPSFPSISPDFSCRAMYSQADASPDALCMYMTSSGTTGRPKVIPVTQNQLYHQSFAGNLSTGIDVLYRPSSIEFNNTKKQRLRMAARGGVNVFAQERTIGILDTCKTHSVTRLGLSAAQALKLAQEAARDNFRLPDKTHLRIGGSAVGRPLRREILEHLTTRLHVAYSASEFGTIATAGPCDHAKPPNYVGQIHAGVSFEIVDDKDHVLPPGEIGHIRVSGAGMATHYVDDQEASERAFREGWFYSGDMGYVDDRGAGFFAGRSDDMMKFASISVSPVEIERVVDSFPGVVESAAFAIKSGSFGDIPGVAVTGSTGLKDTDIAAYARQRLGLRAPRKVVVVDALPRNTAGKVLRSRLAELFGAGKTRDLEPLDEPRG